MVDTIPPEEFREIFDRFHKAVNLTGATNDLEIERRLKQHPKFDQHLLMLIRKGFAPKAIDVAERNPKGHIARILRGLVTRREEVWVIREIEVKRIVFRDVKGRFAKRIFVPTKVITVERDKYKKYRW